MLTGRTAELQYLNNCFSKEGSQILVVYGQRHIGRKALLKGFLADKQWHYYRAAACSEREHLYQWGRQLTEQNPLDRRPESFRDVLQMIVRKEPRKQVLVVDEFQNLFKAGSSFVSELVSFVRGAQSKAGIMVLLVSSSIGWVENSMVTRIGEAAYEISGFLKIRELPFAYVKELLPKYGMKECVETYAVFGGLPELWEQLDEKCTLRQNICRLLLDEHSLLMEEGERLVAEQLREPSVYNTILASLASGNYKLNELYLHTGFSRAKISVYLKSLMELELVEKVFSCDTEGRENVQKGIYRIAHPLVAFYFTYIYPNRSSLMKMSGEAFYERYIRPSFGRYVSAAFQKVCRQDLSERGRRGELPISFESVEEWVGKAGTIDLIARDEEGRTLIGLCCWNDPVMSSAEYERLCRLARKARIEADYICLYSAGEYDEELSQRAAAEQTLRLIRLAEM